MGISRFSRRKEMGWKSVDSVGWDGRCIEFDGITIGRGMVPRWSGTEGSHGTGDGITKSVERDSRRSWTI